MDTVTKGRAFEEKVFTAVKAELDAGHLGLVAKSCKIYRNKSYYSRDRHSDIETDISIEVFLPGQSKWSILWVIECKDYKGALPVDEVEEFCAKTQQIAALNVKATLAVTGALQRSALEYALSKGIGIVRILPTDQVGVQHQSPFSAAVPIDSLYNLLSFFSKKWAKRREEERKRRYFEALRARTIEALTDPSFTTAGDTDFYACDKKYFYENWLSLMTVSLSEN